MRPPGQKLVITTNLEGFMKLRNQLEHLLKNLHEVIQRGETWLQEKDEGETYAQISQFLAQQMESYPSRLCNIAVGNEESTEVFQSPEQESQENKTLHLEVMDSSYTQGGCDEQTIHDVLKVQEDKILKLKENVLLISNKYDELSHSSDKTSELINTLQKEHTDQANLIKKISEDNTAATATYNSRFDKIMTDLSTTKDFTCCQAELMSEKVTCCEEKIDSEFNEKLKTISMNIQTLKKTFENFKEETNQELTDIPKNIDCLRNDVIGVQSAVYDILFDSDTTKIQTLQQNFCLKEKKVTLELCKREANGRQKKKSIQFLNLPESVDYTEIPDGTGNTSNVKNVNRRVTKRRYYKQLSENKKQVKLLEDDLESLRIEIETSRSHKLAVGSMTDTNSTNIEEDKLTKRFNSTWSKLWEIINQYDQTAASSSSVDDIARKEFSEIGEKLQKKHEEFIATLDKKDIDSNEEDDPYYTDSELRTRLNFNKRKSTLRLESVKTKFSKYFKKDDDDDDGNNDEESYESEEEIKRTRKRKKKSVEKKM